MAVFRLLARRAPDTVSAGEIADALDLKSSTLSVYVSILSRAGLVTQVRDGRFIRYGIDLGQVGSLVDFLVNDCCRGRPELYSNIRPYDWREATPGNDDRDKFSVLFVCTGNSARSIFAEAILNAQAPDSFLAYSAGTKPYDALNPGTVEVLEGKGYDVSRLHPKSLDLFLDDKAPRVDFVFTVCDHAANEECPPIPGHPVTAYWGMQDPVKVDGGTAEKSLAFQQTYGMLERRLKAFVSLPFESLNRLSLQRELDGIGSSVSH
jgi:protein-tyrosine-phosphatase/DNA-binding transcriptional ArsR family regulator